MNEGSRITKPYLSLEDFSELFGLKRKKALLAMTAVGAFYIGRTPFVRTADLERYLEEHGSICITWPRPSSRKQPRG